VHNVNKNIEDGGLFQVSIKFIFKNLVNLMIETVRQIETVSS